MISIPRRLPLGRLCCVDGSHGGGEGGSVKRPRRPGPPVRLPRLEASLERLAERG
jgi:hypothetical protein